MRQFDVCRARGSETLLVNCQSDFLSHLPTRFVVPLLPLSDAPDAAERFNPIIRLHGQDYHFAPQYSASVRTSDLQTVGWSVDADYERVTAAIDFLIGGF